MGPMGPYGPHGALRGPTPWGPIGPWAPREAPVGVRESGRVEPPPPSLQLDLEAPGVGLRPRARDGVGRIPCPTLTECSVRHTECSVRRTEWVHVGAHKASWAPWGPRAPWAQWGPRAPRGGRLWALWGPRAPMAIGGSIFGNRGQVGPYGALGLT